MRTAAELIARAAGVASRRLGRGGGTSLPGVVLLKLRPRATEDLAAELGHGSVAISATNGKTTTARFVDSGLSQAGLATIANRAGANLLGGVTSALLGASHADRTHGIGLFEVDEAALPAVAEQARPTVITLINLFRDQLDRYGELETIVDNWRTMIAELPPETILVLNADDPAVASLGADRDNVVWFGVDAPSARRDGLAHAADSTRCRVCSETLKYETVNLGHLGRWACPNGDSQRPELDVSITKAKTGPAAGTQHLIIDTPAGPIETTIKLPGVHNIYNAAAATATLGALDISPADIAVGLAATHAAFGRAEMVTIGSHTVVLMLAKNPTGANTNVRTVLDLGQGPLHVLALLNDRTADGRDVSWIWDVDYEPLLPRLGHLTISGDRAHDLALRFRYAGIDPALMDVRPDPERALDAALAAAPSGSTVYALPTYTALLDLREVLTDRGLTAHFWEDDR